MDYKKAGVDLDRAASLKKEIAKIAKTTYNQGVLAGVGPFGGMFQLGYSKPILIATIDGVGTKIETARKMRSFLNIGVDIVNHCINDILPQGGKPLFFLDYIANDKLREKEVLAIVQGAAAACREAGVALIGGETAQMPLTYQKGRSDIVGVMIGITDRHKIIDGRWIKSGDKILGLPSSGLHTNGFSLVNNLFFKEKKYSPYFYFKEIGGQMGPVLLEPHRSYLKPITALLEYKNNLGVHLIPHGIAHITGGSFQKNIGRILPENCQARIRLRSWPVLPIFQFIQKEGKISDEEMHRVFNMGIGMVLIVSDINAREVYDFFWGINEPVYEIGEIVGGEKSVILYDVERTR